MKALNERKTRYSLGNVIAWGVSCCVCLLLFNGVSLAQGKMGIEDIPSSSIDDRQSSSIDDRLTDFISGPVESISDSILKVRGVEYRYSMNMKCMDMNDRPIDIESVHRGDSVYLVFDVQTAEALSLTLEQRASAIRNPPVSTREKEIQGKRKIIFENGVYKY